MSQSAKELLPAIMQRAGKQHEMLQNLQRAWKKLVGRQVASHARPVSVRRGVLYVHAQDPGISFAVQLEKPRLLRGLRAAMPDTLIDEIVVRAGEVPGELSR